MASAQEILSLYRQFLRYSRQFENYNFREYFLRRSREEFRKLKEFDGDTSAIIEKAKKELGVLRRQSKISQMYHFDKLVVEKVKKH
ncbi:hypothetical protein KL905_003406 [Ogataea polymorpha]|uniref:Complex 1 LYR protein domain-containing protein n=1 Tax=Ogataea polymorpha TaxID=460523 RepID=A0A9P8SZ05_9ASCO|nr:hypothetical protein KL906_003571 [Ogataea polymorpha]KAG7915422.1 hypothetical protein KL927_003698 [Ogataea polymorpha]KAG7919541.1 hypothetical protein KL905_003406 [Ogataea polymorpha]KAH3659584.1 hypothetical protein OGATHE_005629 [Ogataea polymorpha]